MIVTEKLWELMQLDRETRVQTIGSFVADIETRTADDPPRICGMSATFVIVDDIAFEEFKREVRDDAARAVVRHLAGKVVEKFVTEEMPRLARAQQGKGPRKRTGGKHTSKWDRWG